MYLFTKSPEGLNLNSNQLFKLLKPVYGLSGSIDYWGRTLGRHFEKELGNTSCIPEAALLFKKIGGPLVGAKATHFNDTLSAGNDNYSNLTEKPRQKLKRKLKQFDNMQFAGVQI